MTSSPSKIAFAFDIDGVLVRGKEPLPGARETLQKLQEDHIPFIFLTNGGGLTEEAHIENLQQRLGLSLDVKQIVQSHTPYLDLVDEYREKTVLVLGGYGQGIRDLAHKYGLKKVITSSDVVKEFPSIHPFPEMTAAHHKEHGWDPACRQQESLSKTRVHAILVWSSPRDWCLDSQLILDLVFSKGGFFGTRSEKNGDTSLPNCGYQQDDQPRLYFCNPDLEWATDHEQPRLAQGSFRSAVEGNFSELTKGKGKLEYTSFGKPTKNTYAYAENTLVECNDSTKDGAAAIGTVYMVGDNPESDIAGANSFKSPRSLKWKSVLVESGVYDKGKTPTHQPTHITRNVQEAVEWALSQKD